MPVLRRRQAFRPFPPVIRSAIHRVRSADEAFHLPQSFSLCCCGEADINFVVHHARTSEGRHDAEQHGRRRLRAFACQHEGT